MKKILKITVVTVAVLLVAALFAPMLLRGKIAEIVKREANAMLTARLDFEQLDISLLRHFPNASLELKGLTLTGTERFEGDTIVAARRISVVVDLMSLFGDEGFAVKKILLAAPAVHARKLADGAVNWDVMKPSDTSGEEEPADDAESSSFRLSIRDFRISDAEIRYEDDSTGMAFRTSPASLRLKGDLSAAETRLDLRLLAPGMYFSQGGIRLLNDAEAELAASIAADLENNRFTFSDNTLRLNAIEMSLDGWVELRDEAVAMDLTAGCGQVQFKDVLSLVPAFYTREFRNLTASGELSMSLWARGELTDAVLPAFEFKADITDGSFRYASLPKSVTDINISAGISNPGGSMDATVAEVSRFGLKMAGNSLSAAFRATKLASDPSFSVSAAGKVDLGAVKEVYPLEKGTELEGLITADVKAAGCMSDIEKNRYERMNASGSFVVEGMSLTLPELPDVRIRRAAATITPQAMTLGEFGVTVGGSDLSANGQLTGYIGYLLRGDMLSGRLYVKSELLDLNEILEAVPASGEEEPAEDADTALQAVEVPRNLNLSLSTDLQKVLFQKMTITDISGGMRIADGAVTLDKLGLGIFGGKATASGSYSTAADPQRPDLALSAAVSGASFSRTFDELDMIRQLVPIFAKTGGDYSLSLDLSTALDASLSPDLQSLDASGEIRSEHIEVQNIEAFSALAKALNNDKLSTIDAKDVAIRFSVKNGRITTQPFDLNIGGIGLNLSGSTGLDQTIDYAAKVSLPGAGSLLESVSVGIGGTFTSPKITLGVKEAVQDVVKNAVNDQIQKLTGSESLSEEVAKRAETLRAEAQSAGEKLISAAEEQRQKLIDAASAKGTLAKLAAEKAGDKLVEEAKNQAAKLTAEAEAQIEKLTAGTN